MGAVGCHRAGVLQAWGSREKCRAKRRVRSRTLSLHPSRGLVRLVEKNVAGDLLMADTELVKVVPERPYTQTKIVDPGNDDRTAPIYERAVDLGADAISGVPLRRRTHVMGTSVLSVRPSAIPAT